MVDAGIQAADYCTFLDYSVNAQLGSFGFHNGVAQDATLLDEKWESLAMVTVGRNDGEDGEWSVFSLSDEDFITQDGKCSCFSHSFLLWRIRANTLPGQLNLDKYAYRDAGGFNIDDQALIFQVQLLTNASP